MICFTIDEYDDYSNIMELRGDVIPNTEDDEYGINFSLSLDKVYKHSYTEMATPEQREAIKEYIIAILERVFGKNIVVSLGDLDEY